MDPGFSGCVRGRGRREGVAVDVDADVHVEVEGAGEGRWVGWMKPPGSLAVMLRAAVLGVSMVCGGTGLKVSRL